MKINYIYTYTGLFLLSCWLTTASFAQQSITGKVIDAGDNTPLPGVNIVEKGTTNGTVTDIDGGYTISVSDGAVLVFSFVGYLTQEVAVGGRSVLDVSLQTDILQLSEVVVVGYGEQESKDVTGVVAAVDEEQFNRGAIVSPDQLIAGKVAGVQITQNSGEPGGQSTIRIRGGTSINASNAPLYVIDGVPIDNSAHNPGGFPTGRNPLNFLNPSDIETFTVLKDASATAIYGSRAANGVILITTKKGKAGEAKISYDGWVSVGTVVEKQPWLNGNQYRELVQSEDVRALSTGRQALLLNANTDWQAQVLQTAIGQNHTVGVTGGSENSNYRLSLGFLEQEGVVKRTKTQRTNFALNLNQFMLDDKLKVEINIKGSATNDDFVPNEVIGNTNFIPTSPVFDVTNERFQGYWEWPVSFGNAVGLNPVSQLEQVEDEGQTFRSLGNIKFDYELPIEGLTATVNLGYDVTRGERKRFLPSTLRNQVTDSGEVRRENLTRINQLLNLYMKYERELPGINSTFDVMMGYEHQDFTNEFPSSRAFTLSTNIFGVNNPIVGTQQEISNSIQENRLISFFGRANYSYKDRYLLTVNVRRDGSSRFGPENRWGWFPSAALGWRISDEAFLEGTKKWLTDLKLRVGWGINGNQDFDNYQFLSTYRFGNEFARYQLGNDLVTTTRPGSTDPDIKWEETSQINIGVDYGFLNGRLTGAIDFYQKNTQDLLFRVDVPSGTNLSNRVTTNIGELENRGVELAINGVAIDRGDLSWSLGFNISYNKNEITRLNNDPNFAGIRVGGISGGVGNTIQVLTVGQPANTFFTYRHRFDENGNPVVDYNSDGTPRELIEIYQDINGDSLINESDLVFNENPFPDWAYGLTSNLYYKNFDLSFTLRGTIGNDVYNNNASFAGNFSRFVSDITPGNMHESVLTNRFNEPQILSDIYVENASFLRMDNITLGYTVPGLPKDLSLRVYGTIQNLFVISDYSGIDPEVGNPSNQDNTTLATFGIDNNIYPLSRTFIVGLSLGL